MGAGLLIAKRVISGSAFPQLPATLLGRLARSLEFRGRGVGETLLMDALKRALVHCRSVASVAVVTDAKDAVAVSFYAKYGFIGLPDHPNRMFLPMMFLPMMFLPMMFLLMKTIEQIF